MHLIKPNFIACFRPKRMEQWNPCVTFVAMLVALVLAPGSLFATESTDTKVNNSVTTAVDHQQSPKLLSDHAGGAFIVWRDHRNRTDDDIYIQRFDSNGVAQWTPNGIPLCTATGDQFDPLL